MCEYQYTLLDNGSQDIRLIELLPGRHKDIIQVRIHHVPLMKPDEKTQNDLDMSLDNLRADLPPNWRVFRNLEGRFIFEDRNEQRTHWVHPNPSIEKLLYESMPEDNFFEPRYEAISYAWGIDQKLRFIEILSRETCSDVTEQNCSKGSAKSRETQTRLAVTDSLWMALQHLRYAEKSRILWADAICINQNDDLEKGLQVRRMGEIYRLAYRVVVWLGPESSNSKLALSTFEYIAAQIEYDDETQFIISSPDAKEREWVNISFQPSYSHETIAAITALMERAWFKRLWVYQEIHLANKRPGALMQCGPDVISFSSIQKAIIWLYLKSSSFNETLRHVLADGFNLARPKANIMLWKLMVQIVGSQCQDPRDNIYGILGLAPQRFASEIEADYRETCPASEVYKSAFLTHVRLSQRLELLNGCSITGRKIPNLNSWVPDWSAEIRRKSTLIPQFATTTSRVHFIYEKGRPNILQVHGVRCAVINFLTMPLTKDLDRATTIQHVRQWQPPELDFAIYEPTGEPLKQVYALTLINGEVIERDVNYGEERSLSQWIQQALTAGLLGGDNMSFQKPSSGKPNKIHWNIIECLNYCFGRAFFQTEEGYIGLAPSDTKYGDIIAVFLGCSSPMVLRPTGDGSYQLVGECFVHGLHDSIRILGPLPSPWRVRRHRGPDWRHVFYFFNSETGEETAEDPRLEPLTGWERIERVVDADDPEHFDFFKHKETGEVINYDPRLDPEMLEAKGVPLTWFSLE